MKCPQCQSPKVVKNGKYWLKDKSAIQHYLCKECGKRFSDKTGTPMARLRTSPEMVALALKMRSEGMGIRASGRVLEKSHSTIIRWEERVRKQASSWSPLAPANSDVTIESDELYTRVGENLPPQ
jgi:transposase-like protein